MLLDSSWSFLIPFWYGWFLTSLVSLFPTISFLFLERVMAVMFVANWRVIICCRNLALGSNLMSKWWDWSLNLLIGSSLVIRHNDRGPISCLVVGHALRWAEVLIPITCLAVGWGGCHKCQWWWWCLGSLFDICVAYCICTLVSFLSYHSLRCNNLISGVSYPWDIQRPRYVRHFHMTGVPGSCASKGREVVLS